MADATRTEQMTPADSACPILARAPAEYTYWEKRVWRRGVLSVVRTTGMPMARDLALNLARQSAFAHRHQHDYLPQSADAADNWQPHAWVVLAIQAAAVGTPAAPRIDLEQFRQAVVAWSDKAYEESHNPEHPTIQQADRLLALIDASPKGFDMLAHLQRQRDFSERTFGPGTRSAGIVDHIRKELREIEAAPEDLAEWIDVVILALDGAWRSGADPQQIIDALVAKQAKNESRVWPDWRTMPADQAIEHDRSADSPKGGREARDAVVVGLIAAAQAAWTCISELSPTQARVEVAQMLTAAIDAAKPTQAGDAEVQR